MKSPLLVLLLSLASVLCSYAEEQSTSDANAKPSPTVYVQVGLVVHLTDASPGVIRLAKQMSSTYGLGEPLHVDAGPTCSGLTWLEVKPSNSKPDVPYYSVTVAKAFGNFPSTYIYASSEELLEKAINRLKDSAHSESGKLVVPVGKFSYYEK